MGTEARELRPAFILSEFQISGLYQGEVKAYVLVSFQDKYPSSFQLKA